LPGLILALDERLGRITRVMLGSADWNAPRPRGLQVDSTVGGRVVRLGWFATMPAGLLTAFSANGQRTDLVTIPPDTSEQDAIAAMERAAKPANRDHAPAIRTVIPGRSRAVPGERSPHLRAVGGRSS
jgi:CBS domain-containing protein